MDSMLDSMELSEGTTYACGGCGRRVPKEFMEKREDGWVCCNFVVCDTKNVNHNCDTESSVENR